MAPNKKVGKEMSGMMTDEEIYEEYSAFVTQQLTDGVYDTIPHCDSRVLHGVEDCAYCDRLEWQWKRWKLGIANTGHTPMPGFIPCPADAARPPGADNDHRRWYGNRPTSVERDDPSWPQETFASMVMYGDPDER